MTALSLLQDAVGACGDSARQDVVPVTICLWAGMHGLVTLRRDRPSFPWPDLDELIDTLIDGAIGPPPNRPAHTREHDNGTTA